MSDTKLNDASFTPEINDSEESTNKQTYSATGSFRFWCQKVLPLVYDDSLSYYELLCKVVNYLNNVIQNVDNLNTSVDNTNTAFDNLQGYVNTTKDTLVEVYGELEQYVNDYFNNLDVQEEINTKLDAMASNGSLSGLLAPFIPSLVSDWLSKNITPTSPAIDASLSVSGAGADAKATGTKLTNIIINFVSKNTIIVSNLEDGFYNTVNGNKYDNEDGSTYRRSPYLVRVEEKKLYVSNIANLRACCYDKDGRYITSIYLYTKDSLKTTKPIATPANAYFLGLFADGWPTSFSLTKYDSADTQFVEYPFQSDEYLYFEKTWTNSGTMHSADNLDCVVMPNLQAGSKYYVSNNATNCICLKWDGTTVTAAKETLLDSWGAIYTIPDDAALTFWNFYRVRTKGVNDESTEYIAKITKGKVLAIGDSITWLEGKENFGGMAVVSGWQRQLRLAGYDVRNAGWSGHPYANGLDFADGVDYSIYKDVVSNSYAVDGYDYIILFGGTNDVLYNGTLGNRPTDYSNRTFDPSTFNGAIGGIIDYIRTNNTTAKILLASFPKSEAVSRSYINASLRVEELKYNADFWSCKYVNIFADMNVQPSYTQFDSFFYDPTHPNYNGMVRIGKLMLDAVELS